MVGKVYICNVFMFATFWVALARRTEVRLFLFLLCLLEGFLPGSSPDIPVYFFA